MSSYQDAPRDYALALVEDGHDPEYLLLACLKFMSHDDVRGMLDAAELSPRFLEEEEDESYEPRSCGQCGSFGEPDTTCRHCGRGVHGEE
jgi:hypothetical protein